MNRTHDAGLHLFDKPRQYVGIPLRSKSNIRAQETSFSTRFIAVRKDIEMMANMPDHDIRKGSDRNAVAIGSPDQQPGLIVK